MLKPHYIMPFKNEEEAVAYGGVLVNRVDTGSSLLNARLCDVEVYYSHSLPYNLIDEKEPIKRASVAFIDFIESPKLLFEVEMDYEIPEYNYNLEDYYKRVTLNGFHYLFEDNKFIGYWMSGDNVYKLNKKIKSITTPDFWRFTEIHYIHKDTVKL